MRKISLHKKLYLSFFFVILILSFLINVFYAFIEIPKLSNQTFDSLKQNNMTFMNLIDSEIKDMHNTAVAIAYSNLLSENYQLYSKNSTAQDYKALADIVTLILGPIRSVDQVTIYGLDGNGFSVGLINGQSYSDLSTLSWYDALTQENQNSIIYFSGKDEVLSKYKTDKSSKYFMTNVLSLYDNFNNVYGYVEIKKSSETILSALENYDSIYGENIYVYDNNSTVVYASSDNAPEIYDTIKSNGFSSDIKDTNLTNTNHIFCNISSYSDFITVMTVDNRHLLSSIIQNIATNLLITLAVIIVSLLIAFLLSRSITKPIDSLRNSLNDFNLDNISQPLKPSDTNIIELELFYDIFNQLQEKLVENINERILLIKQKTQSQMIALRSQMNPHFMYNSLATIQSMAEENMNASIINMCQLMANILRYISTDKEDLVKVATELKYTEDFLRYMNIRYQGNVNYSITVEDAVKDIHIAKLSIQQFVENSIKFMTAAKLPPYYVSITGNIIDEKFIITISDNGTGFDQKVLERLHEEIQRINQSNLLPELEINGLGILNVYIRLRNIYKEALTFEIANLTTGGSRITIGGPYEQSY